MTFFSCAPTRGVGTEEKNGLHPGTWLVWASCAGLIAIGTTNPFYLLPLASAAWIVRAACAQPGPGAASFRIFARFAVGAVVVRTALVAFGPIGPGSVAGAALEGFRLGVLLIVFGTFNTVAAPARILKLAPRRWHEASLAAALALSTVPRTVAAIARVREAQRLRGLEVARFRSLPALAVPVLQNGLSDAIVLAESMDARGHGRGRRSRYRPEPVTAASIVTGGLACAAAAVFVAAGLTGNGDLSPSMIPPAWPDVAVVLVAASLSLAAPAVIALRE
jgi:energy-coupling factor transporter transmembrane protein EcfT